MFLLDQHPEYEPRTSRTLLLVHVFCMHHTVPPELSLKHLLRAYSSGMASGDVENAAWNIHSFMVYAVYLGKNLDAIDQDYEVYYNQVKSYNQLLQLTLMGFQRQVVQCLLGRVSNPLRLKGDACDVDTFVPKDKHQAAVLACKEHDLAAFMGDDETCAKLSVSVRKDFSEADLSPGTIDGAILELHSAMCCYGMVRKTGARIYLGVARRAHGHVKSLERNGSVSYKHISHIVDAELAALKGKRVQAKQHYEAAILTSARRGAVNYQGIANERFGDYMLDCGDTDEAEYRWKNAIELYQYWGACAKVQQVEEKLASLYQP